jgi:hypothetical protein
MNQTYTKPARGSKSEIVYRTADHKTLGYIWASAGIWLARPFGSAVPDMHDTREAAIDWLAQRS